MREAFQTVVRPHSGGLYKLPKAVPPIAGESFLSLLFRNASIHGFRDPRRLLTRLRLPKWDLERLGARELPSGTSAALASLLNIDSTQFSRMHYGSSRSRTSNINGHPCPMELVSVARRKVCPQCLVESPHHRVVWDLSILSVCLKHGVWLIDHCQSPRCRKILKWTTGTPSQCSNGRCRANLTKLTTTKANVAHINAIRPLIELVEKTNGTLNSAPLDVGDMLWLSYKIGLLKSSSPHNARPISFSSKHAEDLPKVLACGFSIFQNWPENFVEMLDELKSTADERKGRYGVRKQFGRFPDWLNLLADTPGTDVLRKEFARYLVDRPEITTRSTLARIPSVDVDTCKRRINFTDAALILGVGVPTLTRLAGKHDLWLTKPSGKGSAAALKADKVYALRGTLDAQAANRQTLQVQEAHEVLGLNRDAFRSVERCGIVSRLVGMNDDLSEGVFCQRDITSLVHRAMAMAPQSSEALQATSLRNIVEIARFGGSTTGEVLQAMFDGLIAPKGFDPNAKGLLGLLFEPVRVARLTRRAGAPISVKEAALRLNVKEEVIRGWIHSGRLIASRSSHKGISGTAIALKTIEKFRVKYVTATEVAKELGLPIKTGGRVLIRHGAKPVSGPGVDNLRQTLFSRKQIDRLPFVIHGRNALRK